MPSGRSCLRARRRRPLSRVFFEFDQHAKRIILDDVGPIGGGPRPRRCLLRIPLGHNDQRSCLGSLLNGQHRGHLLAAHVGAQRLLAREAAALTRRALVAELLADRLADEGGAAG